jgi:hypothetical protein
MDYKNIKEYLKELNKTIEEENLFSSTESLPLEMRGNLFVTKARIEIEGRKERISKKLSRIPEEKVLDYFKENSSKFSYLDAKIICNAIKS